jgi:hypothetical protein
MRVAGEGLPLNLPGSSSSSSAPLKVRMLLLAVELVLAVRVLLLAPRAHTRTLGVPAHAAPSQGDLHLQFELSFPARLSQAQKMLLAAALFLPAKPGSTAAKALRDLEAAFKDSKHGWSSGLVKGGGGEAEGGAAGEAAQALG